MTFAGESVVHDAGVAMLPGILSGASANSVINPVPPGTGFLLFVIKARNRVRIGIKMSYNLKDRPKNGQF